MASLDVESVQRTRTRAPAASARRHATPTRHSQAGTTSSTQFASKQAYRIPRLRALRCPTLGPWTRGAACASIVRRLRCAESSTIPVAGREALCACSALDVLCHGIVWRVASLRGVYACPPTAPLPASLARQPCLLPRGSNATAAGEPTRRPSNSNGPLEHVLIPQARSCEAQCPEPGLPRPRLQSCRPPAAIAVAVAVHRLRCCLAAHTRERNPPLWLAHIAIPSAAAAHNARRLQAGPSDDCAQRSKPCRPAPPGQHSIVRWSTSAGPQHAIPAPARTGTTLSQP